MRSHIISQLSYEETLKNLKDYHKILINEICYTFEFPNFATNQFIALRKNVEIGFVSNVLLDWECQAVFEYGKKHIYDEYYPLIVDLIKKVTIPRKVQDYCCNINYFYAFPPLYHKNMIYSFFINFFEKPIFKNFNSNQSLLEQELMTHISAFFRKQNKYGPEQITVAILDDQFLAIMISGLLTPFLREFVNSNIDDALFVERMFVVEAKAVLEQILITYFNTQPHEPFIHFDKNNDKLIILSSLSQDKWMRFLEEMSA
ncbi:MAG: hypothetical protein H6Q69_2290 [Firmicutes bacterium]|nr:hypothetical protein [Bacillota bacterium]MBP2659258.1 hypothetical protein [Bacillota bacterium]